MKEGGLTHELHLVSGRNAKPERWRELRKTLETMTSGASDHALRHGLSTERADCQALLGNFPRIPLQDNTQTGSHRPNQAVLTAARAAQPTTSAPRQTVWYIHGRTTSCTHSARRATTVWTKPDPNQARQRDQGLPQSSPQPCPYPLVSSENQDP